MIEYGLPIKCLEAVVLAIYLTVKIESLDRIRKRKLILALSFKSYFEGRTYRHIVLVLRYGGMYGSIGLSRRPDLMGKPLAYSSLAALVKEYEECYVKNFHKLERITIGLVISHVKSLNKPLMWKYANIDLQERDWNLVSAEIDQHQRFLSRLT